MIHTEEFREGNYVILSVAPSALYKIVRIDGAKVESVCIVSIANGEQTWHDPAGTELLPAKLSEEWLMHFGFEKDVLYERDMVLAVNYTLNHGDGKSIRLRALDAYFEWIPEYDVPKLPKMKYVHVLQNLYEDQTGMKLARTDQR